MTNKEYIIAQLGFAPSNDNLIEGALLDAGITATGTYATPADPLPFKQALLQVLRILITTADIKQGEGETANEVKYDRPSILKRIAQLEEELTPADEVGPTIRRRSAW